MMRAWKVFVGGLGVLFLTMACQPGCINKNTNKSHSTINQNETAALVNDVKISTAELDALHKRALLQFTKSNRPIDEHFSRQLRANILRKMMDDEVLRLRAVQEGVTIDRFARVDAFEKYKEKLGGPKRFALYLERQNLTEEQVKKTVEADLLREKLIEKIGHTKDPTDEELKSYYLANQRLYTKPEMVHARHILLKFSSNEPKEKEELVLKKAQQILEEAKKSVSFESLVQKYSEGTSVKNGGDLGFFPRGRMVKAFDDLAFSAPLKTAVGPVKTEFGYHIVYVEEKSPPKVTPFEEVKDRIVESFKRTKRSRQTEELLTSIRQGVTVKINDASLTVEEYQKSTANAQMAEDETEKRAGKS